MSSEVTKQDLDIEAETKFRPSLFFERQTKSEYKMSLRPSGRAGQRGRLKRITGIHSTGPDPSLQTHVL